MMVAQRKWLKSAAACTRAPVEGVLLAAAYQDLEAWDDCVEDERERDATAITTRRLP